jgi:hypothetical protein
VNICSYLAIKLLNTIDNVKAANKSFEMWLSSDIISGVTIKNENCIHEGMKRSLNSANVCYRAVHSLRSFRLLSKNDNIKT